METTEILSEAKDKMKKSVASFAQKLSGLRTGQASAHQFEHIHVECYGAAQPLGQIANVSVPEARQVVIKPWDASLLGAIEKAIRQSSMSVNPNNDGKILRINIPPLTDETREQSIKQARELAEEAKVAVRNVRRDANEKFKKMKSDGDVSEDDLKHLEKEIQTATDAVIKDIQTALEAKEHEIRGA